MTDVVDILLRLRGARQFQSEAGKSAKAIGRIGTDAEESGKKAGQGWKGVAKWAAPAAAFAGVATFMKGAVSSTTDLAKNTMALSRSTGLDAKGASAWATVTKARGIETQKFQMSLTKLSRTMDSAAQGSESARKTLDRLGVSQGTIVTGDVTEAIEQSADAYSKMTNPAAKAALAQQLFGRQALALTPLLSGGSEGIREQLGLAEKYGATLGEDAVGGVKELVAQQREMKIAQEGLKITFGTQLLPVILDVVNAFASLVRIMQPILRDSTVMKVLMASVAAAFIAYKIAVIASTIATLGFNAAFLLIPLAIVAVVAGLVILYKKVGWFREGVQAVFEWIKGHWPLLLSILTGPIGAATIYIIRHWKEVVAFVKTLPGKIASAASGMWNGFKDGFRAVINTIIGWWNGLEFKIPGFDKGPIHIGGFTLGVPDIPKLAAGGAVTRAGSAVVGERGPELINLPRGANVIPIPQLQTVGGSPPLDAAGTQTIVTKVYLDRRQIAEAVGSYVNDKRARR